MDPLPVERMLADLLTGLLGAAGLVGMALGVLANSQRYFVAGGLLLLLGLALGAFISGRKRPEDRSSGGSEGWEESIHQRKHHRYHRRSHPR